MLSIHLNLDQHLSKKEELDLEGFINGEDLQSCMNEHIELEVDLTVVEKVDGMSWCD